jgi:hypothetical protein
MKLTDTQALILAVAAEQQNRLVKPPGIPPSPCGALAAKLRNAGLIEQLRLDASNGPAMAWRHAEGEAVGYRISAAGLAAIGVSARHQADIPSGGPTESTERGQPFAGSMFGGGNAARAAGGASRVKYGLVRRAAAARRPGRHPGGARRLG